MPTFDMVRGRDGAAPAKRARDPLAPAPSNSKSQPRTKLAPIAGSAKQHKQTTAQPPIAVCGTCAADSARLRGAIEAYSDVFEAARDTLVQATLHHVDDDDVCIALLRAIGVAPGDAVKQSLEAL